ncbi:MAG: MarR family winged helix-turn-helix transcriptional regulator [Alphaproteobacteria bacterium]|nr:MarR family winged helix-turn-helix transcriptional regulator [Alphaproteobacteria bacterium]
MTTKDVPVHDAGRAPSRDFAEITDMPGHLLRRCQQIAVSIFLQECRDLDLTPLQYVVLSALDHHGELDQNRLGGLTALDRSTISTVIGKLESRGLVARRRSKIDRRFNAITCAAAGRDVLHRAQPAVDAAQARILAPLEPDEQARFLAYLKRVADGNNQESRAPMMP